MLSDQGICDSHFNSRPHEEVDCHVDRCSCRLKYFNSRPHEEVDIDRTLNCVRLCYFNSRPHEEVDDFDCISRCKLLVFQLTTSRRGRPGFFSVALIVFISTHDLTKRSTGCCSCLFSVSSISTHDLTKRSTHQIQDDLDSIRISTHDLTKRSTAIFTQKVFLSKLLFVLIAYNIFILH